MVRYTIIAIVLFALIADLNALLQGETRLTLKKVGIGLFPESTIPNRFSVYCGGAKVALSADIRVAIGSNPIHSTSGVG